MKHPVSRHTKAPHRDLPRGPDAPVARRRRSRRSRSHTVKARSAYFWTAEDERLLARTMKGPRNRHATRELAKRLGLSQAAVETHRRAKFGRVQRAPRAWTPREDRLLGTRRDAEVARLIGRHPATVLGRRRRLGIPPAVEPRPWTPQEDQLLGTASDGALAKKLGRPHAAIFNRRHKLGIPHAPSPAPGRARRNGCWAPCRTPKWRGGWAARSLRCSNGGKSRKCLRGYPAYPGAQAKTPSWAPGPTRRSPGCWAAASAA